MKHKRENSSRRGMEEYRGRKRETVTAEEELV